MRPTFILTRVFAVSALVVGGTYLHCLSCNWRSDKSCLAAQVTYAAPISAPNQLAGAVAVGIEEVNVVSRRILPGKMLY